MNEAIEKILRDRYYLSTESTWNELAERVGKTYEPITEHIKKMEFIPSSPTLMNSHTNGLRKGTLSSCFPMGIEDSIDGIFNSLSECAKVTKAGGGIGIDWSALRGSSEGIKTLDSRKSSGPLPFISIFNEMLDGVNQAGCLTDDHLISTDNGLLYLDEIITNKEFGWHEHELNINTETTLYKSKEFYCNGLASILKITTEHGYELIGTLLYTSVIFGIFNIVANRYPVLAKV